MSGFSINLKSKGKKSLRVKKKGSTQSANVFGIQNVGKQSNITKLTHVDEFVEKEIEEQPKLTIKPHGSLRYSLSRSDDTETHNEELKFGLTKNCTSATKDDTSNSRSIIKNSEEQLQRREMELLGLAPEMTQEEEYENVPVEEFGDALLRGMGWDGRYDDDEARAFKEPHQKKLHLPNVSRPDYAGIGAEVEPSGGKLKNSQRDQTYLPIIKIKKDNQKRA